MEGSPIALIIPLILAVFYIVCFWKVFTKAGKPGWASIIPIYNAVVLCQIAGKPGWWFILLCIPVVNFVIAILVMLGLAENFGKSAGFGVGLIFLGFIFYPILAFGSAEYVGGGAEA
ncbi:MAG: signal peptidase I [Kiritimatiellae bacterium]|nr:signal peptidase I [Kiritimatiellia bacterium]